MPNLWGVPLWELLLSAAVMLGWTWWRVRQGAVGGLLSVTLSVLSTGGECAAFFVTASPLSLSLLGFQLIGALTLSALLLDTWAKRIKKSQKLRNGETERRGGRERREGRDRKRGRDESRPYG